ncbi:MAG: hypothetical protein PHV18_14435 [Lachnospiraceae bacterium]|nr:hypothetical protein [Lachnospiraceae bacterium]
MLFGRKKPGFVKEEEVQGGVIKEGASASIDKDGVITVHDETQDGTDKEDLLDFLAEQPDAEDPYAGTTALEEAMEAAEEALEQKKEMTRAQQLAQFIRSRSQGAHLTAYQMLKTEDPEIDTLLAELQEDETCGDIVSVKGSRDHYYYSNGNMSDNYAMIAMYVEEKDLVVTIAQMVRFNCKTYPAPTPMRYFENHPYFYTETQIERALDLMKEREEYKDIRQITNSAGVRYLFSDTCMTPVYAKALCEPDEFTD